jgi:polyhydroxyalkanoate synthase
MQAGQQATERFDEALAAAMGVEGKPAKGEEKSPFAVTAGLQQQYWSPILDFWRDFFDDKSARGGTHWREHRARRSNQRLDNSFAVIVGGSFV